MKAFTLLFVSLLMVGVGNSPGLVSAEELGDAQIQLLQTLNLPVGQSKIVETQASFKRASVADPDVADQIVLSTKQLYLTGKSIGSTTLTLWGGDGKVANVFNILVHLSIDPLKQNLATIFPDETKVTVTAANEHIVLTGQVSSRDIRDKIGRLAAAYAPQKVLNWLQYLNE